METTEKKLEFVARVTRKFKRLNKLPRKTMENAAARKFAIMFYVISGPVENFLMFDNAYKNDQKVHFLLTYTQRNMQKKTVDIIRLIICYSL